jgi:hypothetical protein
MSEKLDVSARMNRLYQIQIPTRIIVPYFEVLRIVLADSALSECDSSPSLKFSAGESKQKGSNFMQRVVRRMALALMVTIVAGVAFARDNKVTLNGYLMDKMCSAKALKSDDPTASAKKHTKECAEACTSGGFGVVTDKKFYLFDAKGNELTEALLKATKKSDALAIQVTGTVDGDKIHVDSITEAE